MKTTQVLLAVFLLLASTVPARADFKYTETTQMTGGSLLGVMKATSIFMRGDAKKQEKQLLDQTVTTHYLKAGRLRTDHPDNTAQIIDLEGRRVISIDLVKKTYAVATFDEIRAAMEQMEQSLQQQVQQSQPTPQQKPQDVQVQIKPTIHVTPGTASRVILDQPTVETKVNMDIAMQGVATGADAPPPGQPNSVTATMSMDVDTYVAPGVDGYQEFAQFYVRMAQEVGWMKLPAMSTPIDPRVSQGMSELQKNSAALKGFPLLSYVTMSMVALDANGQPIQMGSQNGTSTNTNANNPPPAQSSAPLPDNSPSGLMVKGLGGLFGKKKDNSSTPSNQPGAPPPNPNSNPNALMEMTTQVTSFSVSSLDGSLFDIPAGFMLVQEDPMQVFGGGSARTPQPPSGKK